MIEIEKPKIETEILSNDGTYGKFVVEPLERGFGTDAGQQPAAGTAFLPAGCCSYIDEDRRCSA